MQEEGGAVSTSNGAEEAPVPSEEVCSLSQQPAV